MTEPSVPATPAPEPVGVAEVMALVDEYGEAITRMRRAEQSGGYGTTAGRVTMALSRLREAVARLARRPEIVVPEEEEDFDPDPPYFGRFSDVRTVGVKITSVEELKPLIFDDDFEDSGPEIVIPEDVWLIQKENPCVVYVENGSLGGLYKGTGPDWEIALASARAARGGGG